MRRTALVIAAALASVAVPAFAADGAATFNSMCKMCHQAKSTPMGPSLNGVAGRKIASQPDFAYSAALKAKGEETWTDANLDALLAAPAKFAPGTRMMMAVGDAETRKAVIEHLKTLK